jgi:hypothetical protein
MASILFPRVPYCMHTEPSIVVELGASSTVVLSLWKPDLKFKAGASLRSGEPNGFKQYLLHSSGASCFQTSASHMRIFYDMLRNIMLYVHPYFTIALYSAHGLGRRHCLDDGV